MISQRLKLEHHMNEALRQHEISVHYQPKVDARSKEIVSFEALVRWFNPELGDVSPEAFIPIAEQNGLIDAIDLFVLQESLATLSHWQKRFNPKLSMAINLSPVHFRTALFIERIERIMSDSDITAGSVELEITEGVLLHEYSDVAPKLKALRAMGIRLALDDFGTGYSSLSYLRRYRFDCLKIDKEFISDIITDTSDRKLVTATIAMAHELDMQVVAEGVEELEQCHLLQDHHCDFLQGWLFSKALPKDAMEALLEEGINLQRGRASSA